VLDRPTPRHYWGCYFCMCHQLVSSGTPTRSIDLRSPLFPTIYSCALWDCQTLLHNSVVTKVVFGCMMKHTMGCEWIKMNLPLLDNRRDISGPLELDGFESA
jgi:hypothetical protein